jgi:L-ascorbate metabolism protein UlaG (beta-lactamase superfamily)
MTDNALANTAPRVRRRRWPRLLAGMLSLVPLSYLGLWGSACEAIGAAAQGARLERMHASTQWHEDKFDNRLPRVDGPAADIMTSWLFGKQAHAEPSTAIPTERRTRADYDVAPASGLRVTWLGHSTLLVEIDGKRVLIDPVWGERASPFSFAGPKRWYPMPLPLHELPPVDAIVISHDHYDHLDTPTIKALANRFSGDAPLFVVPLGVGADLEMWGVEPGAVIELDWWDDVEIAGLTITATPARHFSGRWLDDQAQTLWAGYVIASAQHRVYYSGDTALFPELVDIGDKLGPFDLTMIEAGAYDSLWPDVHLGPEQAVFAHRLVGGAVMLPVHWGMFDLALHNWTEPIERVLAEAAKHGVVVRTPKPGGLIDIETRPAADVRWWPDVPWRTAAQAPAYSSHTESLRAAPVKVRVPR